MNEQQRPALVLGLGNPTDRHAGNRHNVGCWFADELAGRGGGHFSLEKKLSGQLCQIQRQGRGLRVAKPATWMNESGRCARRILDYFKLSPEQMLVVYDELDLPVGTARLKKGGGHGGHNGLRDIVATCGRDFWRLRIGIGHPGDRSRVTGHVLSDPGRDERQAILESIHRGLDALDIMLQSGGGEAMKTLHTADKKTPNKNSSTTGERQNHG